jgi:hypothetical protein
MNKILLEYAFSFFAMWLLLLVVSQLLKLWPEQFLSWVHLASVLCAAMAAAIAWRLRDVARLSASKEAERLEAELHGADDSD